MKDNLCRAQMAADNGQPTVAAAMALIDIAHSLRDIATSFTYTNNNHERADA